MAAYGGGGGGFNPTGRTKAELRRLGARGRAAAARNRAEREAVAIVPTLTGL